MNEKEGAACHVMNEGDGGRKLPAPSPKIEF